MFKGALMAVRTLTNAAAVDAISIVFYGIYVMAIFIDRVADGSSHGGFLGENPLICVF